MALTAGLTAEEIAKREADLQDVLASLRIEGLQPSPEAMAIFERYAAGEFTKAEMGAAIESLHERKYGPVRLSRDERP
jgi:hypothetical protein